MAKTKKILVCLSLCNLALAVAGILVVALTPHRQVEALNSSVTIGVGDTVLQVQGYSSPFAQITILEGTSVIGSATSDSSGYYTTNLVAQTHGIRTIKIYGTTTELVQTDTVTYNINVIEHATTQLNTFLPPTFSGLQTSYKPTDNLSLNGVGRPNMNVIITVDSTTNFQTTTNSLGQWSIDVPLASFAAGTHQAQVLLHDGLGGQSSPTALRSFELEPPSDSPLTNTNPESDLPINDETIVPTIIATIILPGSLAPGVVNYYLASVIIPAATLSYWFVLGLIVVVVVMSLGYLLRR